MTIRQRRWILPSGALTMLWAAGCADPCVDDGLSQDPQPGCPVATGDDSTAGADPSTTDDPPSPTTTTGPSTATAGDETGPDEGCSNGIQDGDETDVDCGGSCPDRCDDGEGCSIDDDCLSEQCGDDLTCTPPPAGCRDGVLNGDETDIDCGGSCPGCEDGQSCNEGSDCLSTICDAGVCVSPSCRDGVLNGDETDVDCGGSCPGCENGQMCNENADCLSMVCDGGTCGDEPTLWCLDADGDNFGDPDDCILSSEPVDGRVPNADDCDDGSATTFPGAAINEPDMPDLCRRDDDGDGYGDEDPGPGIDAGTDCDDNQAQTFPGAAFNELDMSNACRRDIDGDGWGEADPTEGGGGGFVPGADCYDGNNALNPEALALTAFLPYLGAPDADRTIVTMNTPPIEPAIPLVFEDLATLDLTGLPSVNIVTSTISGNGDIIGNDTSSEQLYTISYDLMTCGMDLTATVTPAAGSYDDGVQELDNLICGIEFGPDGNLYGINYMNQLVVLDPVTGLIIDADTRTLTIPVDSCGMAFDCRENRLLFANGLDQNIYAIPEAEFAPGADDMIDPTLVAELDPMVLSGELSWLPTGLEYDPTTQRAWLSTGINLYSIGIDGGMPLVDSFGAFPGANEVSNLQYLPICP
ncbi:MAG: hypothetical protein AAGF11_31325 [Myxococcota bacterium]